MNIKKRLKQISTPPPNSRRKEYGIYNCCLEKIFQKFQKIKISIFKNEKTKNQKISSCVCVCACVKDEKIVLFPDVDAVKRQEMPNLPLFSVFGRVLHATWTIYPPRLRNAFRGL